MGHGAQLERYRREVGTAKFALPVQFDNAVGFPRGEIAI